MIKKQIVLFYSAKEPRSDLWKKIAKVKIYSKYQFKFLTLPSYIKLNTKF